MMQKCIETSMVIPDLQKFTCIAGFLTGNVAAEIKFLLREDKKYYLGKTKNN